MTSIVAPSLLPLWMLIWFAMFSPHPIIPSSWRIIKVGTIIHSPPSLPLLSPNCSSQLYFSFSPEIRLDLIQKAMDYIYCFHQSIDSLKSDPFKSRFSPINQNRLEVSQDVQTNSCEQNHEDKKEISISLVKLKAGEARKETRKKVKVRGGQRKGIGCAFCKNNGEREEVHLNHVLKDPYGLVRCPVLRAYICPICHQSGDYAHTLRYCPMKEILQ